MTGLTVLAAVSALSVQSVGAIPCGAHYSDVGGKCVRNYTEINTFPKPANVKDSDPNSVGRSIEVQKAQRKVASDARKYQAARKRAAAKSGGTRRSTPPATVVPASDPAPVAVANVPVAAVSNTVASASAPVPAIEGDIQVITYLDNPATKDETDRRLGSVAIKLNPAEPGVHCETHPSNATKTNGLRYTKDHRLVKGTANFLNCPPGDYTVSVVGRKGYHIRAGGADSKKVTISSDPAQDQTLETQFILVKDTKKTP